MFLLLTFLVNCSEAAFAEVCYSCILSEETDNSTMEKSEELKRVLKFFNTKSYCLTLLTMSIISFLVTFVNVLTIKVLSKLLIRNLMAVHVFGDFVDESVSGSKFIKNLYSTTSLKLCGPQKHPLGQL